MIYRNHANLVSLWTFENASNLGLDAVGSNDLTNNNTTVAGADYDCKQGFLACDFEAGSSQRLSITDASQTGLDITGALSICAWVRFESLAGTSGQGPVICGKWTTSGNQRSYMLQARSDGTNFTLAGLLSADGTAITTITGSTVLATGVWYHLAMVYTGSYIYLYLNGETEASLSYSSGIFNSSGRFEIGNRGDATASYFMDGLIDELAIFNAALSQADINDIMAFTLLPVAQTYYISASGSDGNAGTSTGAAWQTTANIRTNFINGVFNPGDRILFRRGDSFSINSSSRQIELRNCLGTLANPIVFGAYGTGARPYLNDAAGGDREIFVQFIPPSTGWDLRTSHLIIRDLHLGEADANTQSNEVVSLKASHHHTVRNCYFNNIQTSSVSSYTIVGIQFGADTHHEMAINNVFKDIGGEAVYLSRADGVAFTFHQHINFVTGNTFYECDGEGIDLKGNSDYTHITRNFFEACASYGGGAVQCMVGGRYHRIWRNHISRQRGSCDGGILMGYQGAGASYGAMYCIAERNFVTGMTGNSGGVQVNGSANAARNNTIVNCNRGIYLNEWGWAAGFVQRVYNNLLDGNTYDIYRNGGDAANYDIDYNGYSDGPTGIWYWTAVRDFSYVQGTLGFEANGLTSDAGVENTGLYILSNTSPYINEGTNQSGYGYNGTALDIGWWEYGLRNLATFESLFDDLSDFSSTTGAVSASATAKHRDTNGLLVTVSTTPANVTATVSNDRGFHRFYINLANVTASSGDSFKIFQINNSTPAELAAIEVRLFGTEWRVRASITGDSATAQRTPWVALGSDWNCLELWWLREYEDSQAWGEIVLYVNGGAEMRPTVSVENVNNDTRGNCASITLGTIGTIPATCSGSLYLAALTIKAWEYVGPHGPVRENDPDLVALWGFDNSASVGTDASGNANNLTQFGGSFLTNAYFSIGAYDFVRATTDYLYLDYTNQTGLDLTPPFSIMFYIKFKSDGATNAIITKEYADGSNIQYELIKLADGRLQLVLSTNGSTTSEFTSDNPLYSQVWYHCVVVANGTDVRFYVNGVLDSESPGAWSSALYDFNGSLRIGRGRGGANYLDGVIDDLAIFSRAISADEAWWAYVNSVSGSGSFSSPPTATIGRILANYRRRRIA